MKKYSFLFVALVCILVLSFSVIAFAAPASTESAKVIHGKFVAIDEINEIIEITTPTGNETYPLAKLLWVYRDQNTGTIHDLSTDDQVELILNSKNQVAYIKANSLIGELKATEQSKENTEKPVVQVDESEQSGNQITDQQQIKVNTEEVPSILETTTAQDDLEQLKIDIQDPNVKIKIDIKPNHPQHTTTVKINTKGSANIHLSGVDAEQFVAQILGDLTTETLEQKDRLVEPFVTLFNLDPNKLKVHIMIKAKDQKENYHYNYKNNKYKDEYKEKDDVKVNDIEKKEVNKEVKKGDKKDLKKKEQEVKKEMKKVQKDKKPEKQNQKQKHKDNKGKKDGK